MEKESEIFRFCIDKSISEISGEEVKLKTSFTSKVFLIREKVMLTYLTCLQYRMDSFV